MRRLSLLMVVLAALLRPTSAAAQETVEYYGTDAIGSVRIVFDASGNVLGRMDYGPFGEQVTVSTVGHKSYAGLFRDGETGLDYAEARSYQARTGRLSAPDPLYAGVFDPQRWNRYSYGLNAPLGFSDRSGMEVQAVNCGLGSYWCPGQVVINRPNESDKYFNPASYGYQGGEEAARAEAAYGSRVAQAFVEFRESGLRASTNTYETFSIPASSETEQSQAVAVAAGIAMADSPVIGPADVLALAFLVTALVVEYLVFDADNSNTGPRAPGKPGIVDGFIEGKDGGPWVPNPNGAGSGWRDKAGKVWVPTGPGPRAHGGPHWDVQIPGKGYENVYPGGRRR
jgi:RHS repeat-associated protein